MLKSRWKKIGGWRCHIRSSSQQSEIPFVLVHGLIISSLYMIPLAEELARSSEVHAVDLPGFGRSTGPNLALSIEAFADFLNDWLEAEGIDRCHLIANSLGCQIGAAFAARFPNRVASLVMTGPTIDPEAYSIPRHLLRLLADIPTELPRLWFNYAVDLVKAGPIRTISMVSQMFHDRIELRLPVLRCPVLFLRGKYDGIAPQRWLEKAARDVPNGRALVFPGAGHAVHFSCPEETVRAIWNFIEDSDGK